MKNTSPIRLAVEKILRRVEEDRSKDLFVQVRPGYREALEGVIRRYEALKRRRARNKVKQ